MFCLSVRRPPRSTRPDTLCPYPTPFRSAPPAVTISATYPGASAKTLEDAVTQVIEQKMTGIDNLRYMSSTSDSSGQASIPLTFEPVADPDIAPVPEPNKLQLALPLMPQTVQQQGLTVTNANNDFMQVIGFVSPDGRRGAGANIGRPSRT